MYRPILDSVSNKLTVHANQSTSFDVSFLDGNYQRVSIAGNISIGATDWPAANKQGEITVEVYNATTTSNYTVTFNNSLGSLKRKRTNITVYRNCGRFGSYYFQIIISR